MTFDNFKDGAGFAVALQRAQYTGGRQWLAGFDVMHQNVPGLNGTEVQDVVGAVDATLANAEAWNDNLRAALEVYVAYAMLVIGERVGTAEENLAALVTYMVANGHYVAARAVTYGADPADNVVGYHRRITVNKHGETIETGNHAIPDGIKVSVREQPLAGRPVSVLYEAGNNAESRGGSLRASGPGVARPVILAGPLGGCINTNPTLGGNEDTDDGDDITDGTATTGGINGWDQTRTGTPTVKARPGHAFGAQGYAVGIGKANSSLTLTQSYANWRFVQGAPVATLIMAKMVGAALECDLTWDMGAQAAAWDETDLVNNTYVPLFTDLDETGYADYFDDLVDEAEFKVINGNFTDGGEYVAIGGIYTLCGFQLEPGGEWHFCWENGVEPGMNDTVSFGADSQTDAGPLADGFARAYPDGPSLPISGSTLWTFPGDVAISTASLAGGNESVAYDEDLAATGGLGLYTWSVVDGTLPAGLSLNAATGKVSGTPTTAGTSDFVIEVEDALGGRATKAFSIVISV